MTKFDDPELTLNQMAVILEGYAAIMLDKPNLELAAAFAQAAGTYRCAQCLEQIAEIMRRYQL